MQPQQYHVCQVAGPVAAMVYGALVDKLNYSCAPTVMQVACALNISRSRCKRALDQLRLQGLVEIIPSAGHFPHQYQLPAAPEIPPVLDPSHFDHIADPSAGEPRESPAEGLPSHFDHAEPCHFGAPASESPVEGYATRQAHPSTAEAPQRLHVSTAPAPNSKSRVPSPAPPPSQDLYKSCCRPAKQPAAAAGAPDSQEAVVKELAAALPAEWQVPDSILRDALSSRTTAEIYQAIDRAIAYDSYRGLQNPAGFLRTLLRPGATISPVERNAPTAPHRSGRPEVMAQPVSHPEPRMVRTVTPGAESEAVAPPAPAAPERQWPTSGEGWSRLMAHPRGTLAENAEVIAAFFAWNDSRPNAFLPNLLGNAGSATGSPA